MFRNLRLTFKCTLALAFFVSPKLSCVWYGIAVVFWGLTGTINPMRIASLFGFYLLVTAIVLFIWLQSDRDAPEWWRTKFTRRRS